MSATPDCPREADARALYDEAVAEGWTVATAIEAAEARGLAPVGWSDGDAVGRGWDVSAWARWTQPSLAGFVATFIPPDPLSDSATVSLRRGDIVRSAVAPLFNRDAVTAEPMYSVEGVLESIASRWPEPATVRDLCAVLALGWNEGVRTEKCACAVSVCCPQCRGSRQMFYQDAPLVAGRPFPLPCRTCAARGWFIAAASRDCADCHGAGLVHIPRGHDAAEDFARQVAHELRAYGYAGQARRVVWRPVDVIRDALDTGPVWGEGQRTTLYADGRLRHTPDVNRPGEQQWTHLPAARALAAMGLRLGCVDDESVTLVVRSVTT